MTDTPRTLEQIAYNIVNQLGDLYHERIPSDQWVRVRQETNDIADEFVTRMLRYAIDNQIGTNE